MNGYVLPTLADPGVADLVLLILAGLLLIDIVAEWLRR